MMTWSRCRSAAKSNTKTLRDITMPLPIANVRAILIRYVDQVKHSPRNPIKTSASEDVSERRKYSAKYNPPMVLMMRQTRKISFRATSR